MIETEKPRRRKAKDATASISAGVTGTSNTKIHRPDSGVARQLAPLVTTRRRNSKKSS